MHAEDQLLDRYNRVLAGASTESIKAAEVDLAKMEQEPEFLPLNVALICDLAHPVAVRKFAAVYLSKYSKKIIKEKNLQKCTNALQQYAAILKCAHLEIELKALMVSPIEVVITAEYNRALKSQFVLEYIKTVTEASPDDAKVDFLFIAFCGQSLFVRDTYNEEVKDIIKATAAPLIKLAVRLLLRVSVEQSLSNRENSLVLLRMVKEYTYLVKQYFKKLALLDVECMRILYLPELESLVTLALHFNYQENEIASSLFACLPGDHAASRLVNLIKANAIVVLTNFIRLIFTFTKQATLYSTSPLYAKIPDILAYAIQSTAGLLQRVAFYQLPTNMMVLETIDEVLAFFISCLRVSNFYQAFFEHRSQLIQHIIFPCLALTPKDIDNFYDDSQEFVHNTLQIVGRDLRIASAAQSDEPEDEIKQHETLRTLAAEFLNTFCKFQDGTLSHVVEYAVGVLTGGQGQKSLMFLILCILSGQLKDRKDLRCRISEVVMELVTNCAIPVVSGPRKEEDIEYAFLLLTLSKVYFYAMEFVPNVASTSYRIGISVIQSPSLNEVHQYFVFEMFNNLARTEEATQYVQDLLTIYNHLLKTQPNPSMHLLDSYFLLIKYNTEELKKSPAALIEAIKFICLHIENEVQKQQPLQILLCKYWNIVREVGESEDFIPALIGPIQQLVGPLLPYIDGVRNLDFEEDVLMLLTSFVEKGKKVTAWQQKMFEIIPRVFYNQYGCRFGQSFHAIQLFIYYGGEVLAQNYPAIESIIDMSLVAISTLEYNKKPMSEADNCQGALILQSLILRCGQFFTIDAWSKIIKVVQRRPTERPIRFHLLSSNLYALLSLSLIHSHKFFSSEDNEILLINILSEMRVFSKVEYSPKVIIAGLTELLMLGSAEFVERKFTQLLDTVVTMLEVTSVKRQNYFEDEEDEEKEYANSLIMLKNDLKALDEFAFFKLKVEQLRKDRLPLLQRSVTDLPKTKREFFTHILRIERVENEPRQIYRIKRT